MLMSAFVLGFAGSLHCAGMCSPLLMAVTSGGRALLKRVVYNSGRIFTYAMGGFFFSTFGSLLLIGPYQHALSIAFGIALIVCACARIDLHRLSRLSKHLQGPVNQLKNIFRKLLQINGHSSYFLMGMVNGLLPCGLTFVALSYCLLTPSPAHGAMFMAMFGAGTLPVMLGLGAMVSTAAKKFNLNFATLTGIMMIVSGILLIGRGYFVMDIVSETLHNGIVICR